MTISSSLNAGVAGLSANAVRLASISDNISNSATLGYKRAEVDFHALVVGSGSKSRYVAGGVTTSSQRLIDRAGPLTRTDSATDITISGRGFLPVTPLVSVGANAQPQSLELRTSGSFSVDANGYLVTSGGQVLLGWKADGNGVVGVNARETITGLTPVQVDMSALAAMPTTEASIALNLPAADTAAGAVGTAREMSMEYYDQIGQTGQLKLSFSPQVPATGRSDSWTLSVEDVGSGAVLGTYELEFSSTGATAGTLQSVATLSGGAYDPVTGKMTLALPHGPVDFAIGMPGAVDGLTQLYTDFIPQVPVKNGSPVSSIVGVEVDNSGVLYGVFDRGFSRALYQIPVAEVRNPNGLISLGDQSYQVSSTSGAFYLWDAGRGPAGTTSSYTQEESSTDIAHELTQLIQTQRAYSSNAKVIQTVDEMLQETTNLKR